jgi:hypothetical protein
VKPERWWIGQIIADPLAAFAEFTDREAIRVWQGNIRGTQLEFLIREQRSMAFIQDLIQAVPEGGTKGE